MLNVMNAADLSLPCQSTGSGMKPGAATGVDDDVAPAARDANMKVAIGQATRGLAFSVWQIADVAVVVARRDGRFIDDTVVRPEDGVAGIDHPLGSPVGKHQPALLPARGVIA